jgi:hypothetical protein
VPQKAEAGQAERRLADQAERRLAARRLSKSQATGVRTFCYVRICLVLVDRVDVIDRFVVGGLLVLGRV